MKPLNSGPKYTPKGQNENLLQMKAYAFQETYKLFLSGTPLDGLVKPSKVDDSAWEEVVCIFKEKDRVRWLKLLVGTYDINILSCTEDDIRNILEKYVFERESNKEITSKKTIADICTTIRMLFRNIGREWDWCDRKDFDLMGTFLVNSGNPMTTGTENLLKARLLRDKKDKIKKGEKLAGAVSIPMAYTFLVYLLSILIKDINGYISGRITQKERIVNLAYLILLWTISMHEGPRYGEIVDHLKYTNLYVPLHKKVYWLAFAFLDMKTLRHLLLGNHISHYVMSLYKSKKVREERPRMKSVIPTPYNSIDLFTIFIFCMKCILTLDFEGQLYTSLKVFKKKNYSDLRKEKVKHICTKKMTFYSCRYGAAVDDVRSSIEVKESWTRYRMGHTPTSQMKEKYGKNKDRVEMGNMHAPMGLDVFEGATYENNKGIMLEFYPMNTFNCTYNTSWCSETFKNDSDMSQHFDEVVNNINQFVDADEDKKENIKNRLKAYAPCDFSWINEFPMGFHINFPNELMNNNMKKLLDESLDILCTNEGGRLCIDEVDVPKRIPEVWSFPQVIYGNWRPLLSDDISIQLQKPPLLCIQTQVKSRKRPRLCDIQEVHSEVHIEKHKKDNISKEKISFDNDDDRYELSDIEVGNCIVIYCTTKDKYSYDIGGEKYVWFMKVQKVNIIASRQIARSRGWFYMYKDGKFIMDSKPYKHYVDISLNSLVQIYKLEDNESLELTEENINDIQDWFDNNT